MAYLHLENSPWRWPSTYAEAIVGRLEELDPSHNYYHKDIGPVSMFDNPPTVGEGIFREGKIFTRRVVTIRHWTNMGSGPGNITIDSELDKILSQSELQKIADNVKNSPINDENKPDAFDSEMYCPFTRGLL